MLIKERITTTSRIKEAQAKMKSGEVEGGIEVRFGEGEATETLYIDKLDAAWRRDWRLGRTQA